MDVKKLKQQQLSLQQRIEKLRQKQLDEARAKAILRANVSIKKISMLAKIEPNRFSKPAQAPITATAEKKLNGINS